MSTTAPPLDLTTQKLLAHLWRAGEFAYYWTASEAKRANKPKEAKEKLSFWFETDNPAPLPSAHGRSGPRHLYFSVNPTLAGGSQYQRAKQGERDIAAINTLFGEFDFKDFESVAAAAAHVTSLQPAPSVIIKSGGGLHCYWLLAEPFVLSGNEEYTRAQRAQYAWVDFVKSDDAAKDLYRVLRIPETLNYKSQYGPRYPKVEIFKADFERLYSLAELEQLCKPAQPTPKARRDNHITDWTLRQSPSSSSGQHSGQAELETAADCLKRLDKWRVEQYRPWLEVGMSLKGLGAAGLQLWDQWSQGSAKYDPDACERKWATFSADGLGLGSLIHWANEDNPRPRRATCAARPVSKAPEPKVQARLTEKDRYFARQDDQIAEAYRRQLPHFKPEAIPFMAPADYETISHARRNFGKATEWKERVELDYPELDSEYEFLTKKAENREKKIAMCGTPYKRRSGSGQVITGAIMCGLCERCQEIILTKATAALKKSAFDDSDLCLTVYSVNTKRDRSKVDRMFRESKVRRQTFPVKDGMRYEFVIAGCNPVWAEILDRKGITYTKEILDPIDITQGRVKRWLDTPESERISGTLIPNRKKLLKSERPRGIFEVDPDDVLIEFTNANGETRRVTVERAAYYRRKKTEATGESVWTQTGTFDTADNELTTICNPGIISRGNIPENYHAGIEVSNERELQQALYDLHEQAQRRMVKRGAVILGVICHKSYYALSDIPALCELFNERNKRRLAEIEDRRRKK